MKKHTEKNKKASKIIIVLIIICIACGAVLIFVEGPNILRTQIKGLELTQERLSIHAAWKDIKCDGYIVTITADGKKTIIDDYHENEYTIDSVIPGKTYWVEVQGLLSNGYYSRTTSKSITAEKIKQKLTVNLSEYDGFKGDSFKVEAKGKGNVLFNSDNSNIATVDRNGNVKLKKTGHCTINVSVTGNGVYNQKTKEVAVNVYPESLNITSKIEVKNISDTRAIISWKAVDFAKKYVLLKKNLETGKFDELFTIDDGSTEIEITRNIGKYAVKAKAEIADKVIEGGISKEASVTGTTESAQSYSSGKILKSLNRSNMVVLKEIHGVNGTTVPQSLSQTKDDFVVSYVNHGGSIGRLVSYEKNGSDAKIVTCSNMGHANGTTFNPNTNKFYVVKTHKSIWTPSCSTYDGNTKNYAGMFNLPRNTSGIAYDESNNKYYLSKGNEIYVCSSDFKVEKFIHKFVRYNHAQDIGAYNGIVFVCTWVSGNTSYIDMYRASDGAHLGGYNVSIGEIESVVVDDGYLIVLMNNLGTRNDIIYKTKERITLPQK